MFNSINEAEFTRHAEYSCGQILYVLLSIIGCVYRINDVMFTFRVLQDQMLLFPL